MKPDIEWVEKDLAGLASAGLSRREHTLASPQGVYVELADGANAQRRVLNFCSNNYLGLSNHPAIVQAAHAGLDRWGYGLASVRFISGTQQVHRELEERLSSFLHTDDTILYSSCFDANAGLFETLLGAEDTVISDELNHASIIDGIRLCKASRFRYRNCDVGDLERKLREARSGRIKLVVTDGVFSMEGRIAPLREICDLADRYSALVMVDDSHAVGFVGRTGRGTPELCDVLGRIDLVTGTLGKALGGASGGYVSGRQALIELLRQKSRPYLFSNSLCPCIAAASLAALDLVEDSREMRTQLEENTAFLRAGLTAAGFQLRPGTHPIIPVILGDAVLANRFAASLLEKGVFVVPFAYPVVPHGTARIRVQVSAAHRQADLQAAIEAFVAARDELGNY